MITAVEAKGWKFQTIQLIQSVSFYDCLVIPQCWSTLKHTSQVMLFIAMMYPEGMMSTWNKIMLLPMVMELSGNTWFNTHRGEIPSMTQTPQSPDISLLGIHSNAASVQKSFYVSSFGKHDTLMCVWFPFILGSSGFLLVIWTNAIVHRCCFHAMSVQNWKLEIIFEMGVLGIMPFLFS